jgi:hypothetical protein
MNDETAEPASLSPVLAADWFQRALGREDQRGLVPNSFSKTGLMTTISNKALRSAIELVEALSATDLA